ncbi:hypothetical protein KFL_000710260 [Klebsormidium nitens]|uniref:DUF7798 domain-containing protein n=1 Tax=Klebsormidium nitens TaxID=105231 RepID=A0A1Y1HVW0_KLENI|nr:hypothetical protein KFL_000710260 [Klebsormidium nitens]|eukprot:GAQ81121.1 hypothetical protein KFL_000710260 [Klebsormidium nitens]
MDSPTVVTAPAAEAEVAELKAEESAPQAEQKGVQSKGLATTSEMKVQTSEIEEEPLASEKNVLQPLLKSDAASAQVPAQLSPNSGGWGWGLLASVAKAAENFTEAAVETAKEAAKSVAELQTTLVESLEGEANQAPATEGDAPVTKKLDAAETKGEAEDKSLPVKGASESEEDKRRQAALDKLGNASKDSFLGHGLKVLDDSVENLALNAMAAFGSAWKGSVNIVHQLEQQAEALAESEKVKSGLKSGSGVLAKSTAVFEGIGRRTMELLAEETGIELEKDENEKAVEDKHDEEAGEEVTFDRCFYIYGGPEHLEELEALSNHHALMYNRARAKLAGDKRAALEATLKELQKLLTLEAEEGSAKSAAGKKDDEEEGEREAEIRSLREAGISQATDMASTFTTSLGSASSDAASQLEEVLNKATERLEEIKGEGVHRLSELCALCISHLLLLGEAVLKTGSGEGAEALTPSKGTPLRVEWPEDVVKRAELIKERARSMLRDIELLSDAFTTSISEVVKAYETVSSSSASAAETGDASATKSSPLDEKLAALSGDLESDTHTAVGKLQDGLQFLVYPVVSTSMKG